MVWLVQACGSGLRCQGLGCERAEELGWGLEYPLAERLGRKGKEKGMGGRRGRSQR